VKSPSSDNTFDLPGRFTPSIRIHGEEIQNYSSAGKISGIAWEDYKTNLWIIQVMYHTATSECELHDFFKK